MSDLLQISDAVRELVPTSEIAAALTHRRTTELDCAVCKQPIRPCPNERVTSRHLARGPY